MDKEEGRRILRRIQACANFKDDSQAADMLAEMSVIVAEELAKLEPAPAEERAERGGHDRQRKGGRDRALI